MAIGHGVACPKPSKTRKQLKARESRHEAKVKRVVRAACVERDGHCRLHGLLVCEGPSQWAHLRPRTRAHTLGMPATYRHTTAYTCMLCRKCHGRYDKNEIDFILGADGADAESFGVLIDGQGWMV